MTRPAGGSLLVQPATSLREHHAPAWARILPGHVGIMMDGNGRWAGARGLPRLAGHRKGTENVRRVLAAAREHGIRILTLYVFSTENWGRPRAEIEGFFGLLAEVIDREVPSFQREGVRLRHLGSLEGVPPELAARVREAVRLTGANGDHLLNVAFNYGGRADILRAVREIVASGHAPGDVSEQLISAHLSTSGLPEMDLIIRTAGEMRLSNFFPWQGCRAVYFSSPVPWPDFGPAELTAALEAFARVHRRQAEVVPP